MGVICKLADGILLLTFLTIVVVAPVLDAQTYLPQTMVPNMFIRLHNWYITEYQDYLLVDKPLFFVALMKLELVFQFPLALLNIYGLLTSKPWFNTTCLIFGASFITSMTALLGELMGSPKSSEKLVMLYSPFWGCAVVALLRGLLSQGGNKASPAIANGPALGRKKKA